MGLLHAASATHHAKLTLCNASMSNQTIAGSNDGSGCEAGQPFERIFVNRSHLHLCKKLGAGMASASGRGGSGRHAALGSSDGMRWAQ